ncbi:hypothetical protein BOTBODRAFT_113970 [Botryobasidium botryosum FD-172 SS1]|uniref:SAP domain-containing protein n=1 Tax=Botryobasidium botryosum (strain FD-172 SS1) TaxID=930990 RepID=A0A067M7B1_BOTB1|nr:hypothetical protein BOTBODRAFT_113970 [Botryobasidium botryosum FD-172 SS1]
MYLAGLVPGPHALSLHRINHFLDILVDQLIPSFDPGLFYTRTASYAQGRRVRVALVPVVSDVIAARSATGMGAATRGEHFCSFCDIDKADIENFDGSRWTPRDGGVHRKLAERWRDAATEEERKGIFSEYGIRWTPLLRLLYWDPCKMIVIDSMHNLLLGTLKRHCLTLWGMKDDIFSTSIQRFSADLPPTLRSIKREKSSFTAADMEASNKVLERLREQAFREAEQLIERGEAEKLESCLVETLEECATARGIKYNGTKAVMAKKLCAAIRLDMQRSQRPSWLGRAPFNMGSTLHGSMTADQWRNAFTVDFVVTLVRLWSTKGERFSAMLDNYMQLVGALRIAHKHAISPGDIELYGNQMKLYLKESLKLYPSHHLLPNNHLALHLTDFLKLFGPVHAWRCFAFERLNGILQRFNSNMKPSECTSSLFL